MQRRLWHSEDFLSESLENHFVFKRYRRVFSVKGDAVADSARSGPYYIPSVAAQGRQMMILPITNSGIP